jgi:serine/threonine-protein kinase
MSAPASSLYEFGDFRMDTAERLLSRRDGTAVPLTPRVFETLRYLVEHSGTVLEKERLMEAVWPDSIVEENNLSQNISTLRRAFGETPGSQRYIVTVPGRGYRFVANVTRSDNTVEPLDQAQLLERPIAKANGESIVPMSQVSSAPRTRKRYTFALAISALILLGFAALLFLRGRAQVPAISASHATVLPEKSIAVLPFANLSADQENAFFTEGMQDDILTALAKVADLKVISRTSVAGYIAGSHRNLGEIGQELGVSQILEGSVRRAGDKVRVTVQLIDTRTNAHIWAETYDRNLADVFAIQTEIAQQIATQLQAKLSPAEKSALEERPTNDLIAYDFYLRAKALYLTAANNTSKARENFLEAASLLDQAVARSPQFFLAYSELARTHGALYFSGADHTVARLALADAAIASAKRLRPDSGEVHLLLAEHLYHTDLNYDEARAELALAQRTLPNSAHVYNLMAHIDRRQGRWNESTRNYERASELDPRTASYLRNAAFNYELQRRFAEAATIRDRTLKLPPRESVLTERAYVDLAWRADPRPYHETIEAILNENPAAAMDLADDRLDLALCERDPAAASRALTDVKPGGSSTGWGAHWPRAWFEGLTARTRGDATAARDAFAAARREAEVTVREHPDYAPALCVLGMIDAGLGRKEEAMREGRRAVELLPVTKDSLVGATLMENLAIIYAWSGETTLALDQVEATLRTPGLLSYGRLRLHPFWDLLRGDPRFEKIVTELAPKDVSP